MYTYITVKIYKQGICIYKYVHTQFCNFHYSAVSFVHSGKVHFGKLFTFLLIFLTVGEGALGERIATDSKYNGLINVQVLNTFFNVSVVRVIFDLFSPLTSLFIVPDTMLNKLH